MKKFENFPEPKKPLKRDHTFFDGWDEPSKDGPFQILKKKKNKTLKRKLV